MDEDGVVPHPVHLPGVPPDRLDKVEDGVVCLGDAVVGPRRVVEVSHRHHFAISSAADAKLGHCPVLVDNLIGARHLDTLVGKVTSLLKLDRYQQ